MPTDAQVKAHLEATLVGKLVRVHSRTGGTQTSIPFIVSGVFSVEGNRVWLEAPNGHRYYYYINPATRPETRRANWHLEIYGEGCPYAD